MTCCERYEAEISALVDGELSTAELVAAVDHLGECEHCQGFYRGLRHLSATLREARLCSGAGELPAGLWSRIERAAHAGPEANRVVRLADRLKAVPAWAVRVAAAVLVGVTVWSVSQLRPAPAPAADAVLQVLVEGDRGRMTDERFIDLTTEILRADRRYHQKMQEIMAAVNHRGLVIEGGAEGPAPLEENDQELRYAAFGDLGPAGEDRLEIWD